MAQEDGGCAMTQFIIKVEGDPDRPTLFYSGTGSTIDQGKAKRFPDRGATEFYESLMGGYHDRGWTTKIVEVRS